MEPKYTDNQQKRCLCCGRYFRAENQVGKRQKSCKRDVCQKERRKIQQEKWRKANKDYFKGRYEYLKEWRKEHPEYQKQWRAKKGGEIQTQLPPVKSITTIRLNTREEIELGEIQTLVLTLVKSGQSLWVTGARMHPE